MDKQALIIDPSSADRRLVQQLLKPYGWQVTAVATLRKLQARPAPAKWNLILCTLGTGLGRQDWAWLKSSGTAFGCVPHIIALGENRNAEMALAALLEGASDYLSKPFQEEELVKKVECLEERHRQLAEEDFSASHNTHFPRSEKGGAWEIIGSTPAFMRVIKETAAAIAVESLTTGDKAKPPTYFLSGETGTGKELFARLIHQRSRFRNGPFVAVNCATLTADLADAELFGHEAGAYTGATKARPGLWEEADNGTLFLDEITEAPPALLPKLLRVLQDGQVRRVGGTRWRTPRVQVIAASNRDLAGEIAAGRMRRDVYHRFLHHLHLPTLRERREDLPLLVEHFAQRYATRPVQFSAEAMELLHHYSWPGNVRELEHTLRAAVTQTVEGRITAAALQKHLPVNGTERGLAPTLTNSAGSWEERVQEFRLHAVQETLTAHRGNVTRAAAALGMTRAAVYKILRGLAAHSPTA